jgi:hypothetical protein
VVHDLVAEFDGSISAEHGIGRLKVGDLERYGDPVALAAMRAIKTALDPAGILNPRGGAARCRVTAQGLASDCVPGDPEHGIEAGEDRMSISRRQMMAGTAGLGAAFAFRPLMAQPESVAGAGFMRTRIGEFEVVALSDGAVQRPLDDAFVRNASLRRCRRRWQRRACRSITSPTASRPSWSSSVGGTSFSTRASPTMGPMGRGFCSTAWRPPGSTPA